MVIPALEEEARIAAAVRSARAPGVEVLVVDGGSADATAERARAAGAAVVESPPGRARQLGLGAHESQGQVIVFLHADTLLPEGFADRIRRALEDPRVVGGAFRLRFDERSGALRCVEWGARLRGAWFGLPYGDQALFVRRAALDGVGGVPQAPIMEDLDLVRALRRRGRLAILPEAATTSARRYVAGGVFRTMLRHWGAVVAWLLGLDRERVAAWVGR